MAIDGLGYYFLAFDPRNFAPNGDYALLPFVAYIPITVLAFFSLADRLSQYKLFSFPQPALGIHLVFLATLIGLGRNTARLQALLPGRTVLILKLVLAQLVAWTALLALANIRIFLGQSRRYRKPLGVAMLATSSSVLYLLLNDLLWKSLSKTTGLVAWLLLRGMGYEVSLFSDASSAGLRSDLFSVQILAPCSGLEGIFFFVFVFSFVLLIDWDLFRKQSQLTLYLFGFLFALLLNAVRIALFFSFAARESKVVGKEAAAQFFVRAFHSYSGVLIYLLGVGVILIWLYRRASHLSKEIPSDA